MGRSPTQDPRGYYRVLGLSPSATEAAVKAAYRKRALTLHPDRNKSSNASAEFHFLTTAYRVLSDPKARDAYHRDSLNEVPSRPKYSPSSPPSSGSPRSFGAGFRTEAEATTQLPPLRVCSSCQNVTAQPRYIIFPKVTGKRRQVTKEAVSGVFCRRCADRVALVTSLHNWVRGWWAFPSGPWQTILALWTNLWGGIRPNRENHALLMEQARAFQARGQREIAFDLAGAAKKRAPGKPERQMAERLMNALGGDEPARRLRDVWRKPGPGFWLQILFPCLLLFSVALVSSPWLKPVSGSADELPMTGAQTQERPRPLVVPESILMNPGEAPFGGRVHAVISPELIVRAGPGPGFDTVMVLKQNTFVVVVDTTPNGWARIVTAQGEWGYTPGIHLLIVDPLAGGTDKGNEAPPSIFEKAR